LNGTIADRTDNVAVRASALDARSDALVTLITIAALLLEQTGSRLPFDGLAGVFVSLFILRAGISMGRDVINRILGQPLPPETFISLLQGYPNKSGILKAVQANSVIQQQMQQLQAQVEQLTAQLDQQKRANAGYLKALTTAGGGAAQAQQSPDYGSMMQSMGKEKANDVRAD
jgi:Co/Zn/Cd efflux system component